MLDDDSAPAGWYPDPPRPNRVRYWDGDGWTDWTFQEGWRTITALVGPTPGPTPRRAWPPRVIGTCIVGLLLSVLAAGIVYGFVAAIAEPSPALAVGVTIPIQYYGMFVIARRVSRRYGTGDVVRDLRWRVTRHDVWPGIGTAVLALVVAAAVGSAVRALLNFPAGPSESQFGDLTDSSAARWLLLLVAVFGAPIFEELLFRGLVLPALHRLRPLSAIAISSALFASTHLNPSIGGRSNVLIVASTFSTGSVLAWAALRTRRLGPVMIAHSLFNLPVMLLLIADAT